MFVVEAYKKARYYRFCLQCHVIMPMYKSRQYIVQSVSNKLCYTLNCASPNVLALGWIRPWILSFGSSRNERQKECATTTTRFPGIPKYIGAEYLIITLIRLKMAFSCFVAFWVKIYTLTDARCHTPYFSSFVWNQWNGSDFQVDDSRTRIQMHSAQYATSC